MIEAILRFSLGHRLLMVLLTLAAAAFGAYSLLRLPIDAVPDITNNQVQINTPAPALSPEEVEKRVTFPVETALAGIPGLESTRSISRNGFSQVTAIFDEGVDLYFARQQVSERLSEARESLPAGAEPRMGAISTGLGEVYMWTVSFAPAGDGAAPGRAGQPGLQADGSYLTPEFRLLRGGHEQGSYLRTVQDWIIRPQLKGVPGVAGVDAIGGYVRQYQVAPDPHKLAGLGIGFGELAEALERNNTGIGAGYIERNGEAYVVRADGRIASEDQIGAIVVAHRRGVPIYVRDVASVGLGRERRTGSASSGGAEVVVGTALMLIGENSRTVAQAVDRKLAEISRTLPPDVRVTPVLNRTALVDRTIATVQKNLTEGALLVVAVLFLLLGNLRAALIAALVIPLSMLMTAMGMVRSGISGNLMSLGALDFGLIVDGAVIITENALRHLAARQRREGRLLTLGERLHEVMQASREMIQPTVFGQAIIIMVYVPLLSLSGVEGKMFEPMAVTVIMALAAAFVLSLTFVPAAIALFVTGRVEEAEGRIVSGVKARYAPVLRRALARPLLTAALAGGAFLLSLAVFARLGQEFIPTLDEKDIAMHAMRIPSTGLAQSQEMQFQVERAIAAFDEVALVFSKTGTAEMAADPMPPNVSDTFIILKPRGEWPDPALAKAALIERIEAAVSRVPGNAYEFTQPIQMRFNELISGVRSDVAVKVYGDDFPAMEKAARAVAAALRATDGAADVKVEQTGGLPMLEIQPDRDAIARYGLNVSDVLETVAVAVGGREAGLVFEGDRRFSVVVRLADALREDEAALKALPIPLPPGGGEAEEQGASAQGHAGPRYVPLGEVARLVHADGPNQISRENGKRRVVVQANVRGRDIGSFVADAEARIASAVSLPPGYWLEWGGQFRNLEDAKQRLMLVVPACFGAILLLLFTALGSVRQALLVFTAVPLALTGGILALWLRGMPFSISAAVGFIALSGIAVLNGLVMIASINARVRRGQEAGAAVYEGALQRVRPVMMTALVASLGFVPMALATGAGAEVQKPLATVIIGGLITATALTLVVLPALYRHFRLADAALRATLAEGEDMP